MKRSGKVPDTPRIHGVRRQLARWRQTRPHPRAPIPAAVWAAAVALARQHGIYSIARALPIDYGALKAQVARADGLTEVAGPPTFVELAVTTPPPGARVCHRVRRPARQAPSAGPWSRRGGHRGADAGARRARGVIQSRRRCGSWSRSRPRISERDRWVRARVPRGPRDRSVRRRALRVSQSSQHRDQVFGLRLAGVLARAEAPVAGALSVVAHGRDGGGPARGPSTAAADHGWRPGGTRCGARVAAGADRVASGIVPISSGIGAYPRAP